METNFIMSLIEAEKNLVNNPLIHIFLWVVILDILSGTIKGVFFKKEGNSRKGLLGLVKHFLIILLVLIGYPYCEVLDFTAIGNSIILAYIVFYALSIIENWGQMGLYVPDSLKKFVQKLQESEEKK